MKQKKKLIILVIIVSLIAIGTMVGLTYAFFTAGVEGNDGAEATEITTGTLQLRLSDTAVMNMNDAFPGRTESKVFTVENIGDAAAAYDLDIIDVSTSFIGSDLKYTIT